MPRGRPRKKDAERYPSGQLKRPTTIEQMAAAEKAREEAEMVTVLRQPHRIAFGRSQMAECALGRFVLKHRLRSELFQAGDAWANTKRKWLSVKGAPLPDKPGGTGADVPSEIVDKWAAEALEGEQAMMRAGGPGGLLSVVWMAFDGFDFAPGADVGHAMAALMALAVATGRLDARAVHTL
jgi:hypothetical protein